MTKFFRKYSKFLLVAFGVFLMVSFIVPQAIQQFGQSGPETTVMRVDGRRVSFQDTKVAAEQVAKVEQLSSGMLPTNSGIDPHGEHWLLAREFARSAGWVGGPSSGLPLLKEIAAAVIEGEYTNRFLRQFNGQIDAAMARNFARQTVMGSEEGRKRVEQYTEELSRGALQGGRVAREGLAAAMGIARMRAEYQQAARLSEPRLMRDARKQFDRAEVSVVFVGVDNKLSTGLPAREEAALIAHYEKYKDKRAGADSPFGYLLPDRVKLEWLMLDRAACEKAVKVDPIEVQKRIVAGASGEITEAAKRRTAVEGLIRREQADNAMNEASVAVKSEILKAVSRLHDDGAYKALPADWAQTMPRMAAIAKEIPARVQERTGMTLPEPSVFVREATWQTIEKDLGQLPGIGQATVRVSGRPASLTAVVRVVKELLADTEQQLPVHPQAGVPMADAFEDASGNRYFCTVLGAAKQSPPASLDEVREAVVADKKKADAFETLKTDLNAFRLVGGEQGLEALAEQFKALTGQVIEVKQGVTVRRSSGVQPAELPVNTKEFADAVMDAASQIDATKDLSEVPKEELVVAVALPGKLGVAVAKITEFSPVTREEFRKFAEGLQQQLAMQDLAATADDPFALPRLEKRLGVERKGVFAESRAEEEKQKAAAASAAKDAASKGAATTPASK